MGDKQNAEMTLCYLKDGQWEKIGNVKEFPEFHSENVEPATLGENPAVFSVDGVDLTPFVVRNGERYEANAERLNGSFTGTFKIPKRLRCHSRKRFKKLLMSCGIPRNVADKMKAIGTDSYEFLWFYFRCLCLSDC